MCLLNILKLYSNYKEEKKKSQNASLKKNALNIWVIRNEVKTNGRLAFMEKCLHYFCLIIDFQRIPPLCEAKSSVR